MKCTTHPEIDAIAACPLCGKSLCEACRVNVNNIPHCKTCAEWLFSQMVHSPFALMGIPHPKGRPRREYFIVGGIGALILMVTFLAIGYRGGFIWYDAPFIPMFILFSIGFGALGIGFIGFFRNYGSIIGLISGVMVLICSFLMFISTLDLGIGSYNDWIALLFLFMVITFAFMGITLVVVSYHTMVQGLSKLAGISIIFAAIFFTFLIGDFWLGMGFVSLAIASLPTALTFFLAKLSRVHQGVTPTPPVPVQLQATPDNINPKSPGQMPPLL